MKYATHTQGPGWLGLVPVSAFTEAASRQAAGHPSSSWSSGPAGARRPGPPRGSEEPGAGDQEPGARRPDPVPGHREHDSVRVGHSEVTAGRGDRAVVWEFDEKGPLFVLGHFLQSEGWTTEEPCGPPCGHGTAGTGLASEFALPGAHGAPHPVSPLQAVGSQARGGVWRSRQAESSSLGYPKTLDKGSQGGHAGSGHLDWHQGLGHSSAPAPVRALTPRGARSSPAPGGTHTVLTLVCRPLGELSKRHLPNPSVPHRPSLPWHLCLEQLVPKDAHGLQGSPADTHEICGLEFSGSCKVPAEGTLHPCVCLGHRHGPVHMGKQSRTSEVPSDPPSSDVGNRILTQEQEGEVGTTRKGFAINGPMRTGTPHSFSETHRHWPAGPRGTGGNPLQAAAPPSMPPPPSWGGHPQGGDHRAGVQGGPGAFMGKGGLGLQITDFCDHCVIC